MKINSLITVAALLIAIALVNYLAARHPFRADITENGIYTLSDSTKKILARLEDVATIRVYFTREMPPALEPMSRDVEDLLDEFKRAAGTRLQIEHVDPGSSSMEEQRAQLLGIPPVQLNVINQDKQEVAKIYLGIAVMYGDKQQVIPVVQDAANLEYELAEALVNVSSKELKNIAWWGPKDVNDGSGFKIIKDFLSRRYKISDVEAQMLSELTPEHYSAVVLVSPRKLDDDELFALDQYLMAGGRIIALVDRWELGKELSLTPVNTEAADLVMNYGATVEDSLVLDEQNAMAAFSGGVVTYHVPYPYWVEVRKSGLDSANPVTANLQSIVFPWDSPLALNPDAQNSGSATAVAASTDNSATIPGKDANLEPQSANAALRSGARGSRILAAMLTGPFKSYFGGAGRPAPGGREAKVESAEGARIFVAGSSHWMNDRFLQTFPQNAALFQNVLDLFAMGDVLIGIRSREETSRPIAVMPDGARVFLRYANLAAGPLLLAVIGAMAFALRRRHRRAAAREYGRAA